MSFTSDNADLDDKQKQCHSFLRECSKAKVLIKIPSVVLSAWAEWNSARGDTSKIRLERVDRNDPRLKENMWHKADVETRPCTPSLEIADDIAKIKGKYAFHFSNSHSNTSLSVLR
jgi:hypothetical protein